MKAATFYTMITNMKEFTYWTGLCVINCQNTWANQQKVTFPGFAVRYLQQNKTKEIG